MGTKRPSERTSVLPTFLLPHNYLAISPPPSFSRYFFCTEREISSARHPACFAKKQERNSPFPFFPLFWEKGGIASPTRGPKKTGGGDSLAHCTYLVIVPLTNFSHFFPLQTLTDLFPFRCVTTQLPSQKGFPLFLFWRKDGFLFGEKMGGGSFFNANMGGAGEKREEGGG